MRRASFAIALAAFGLAGAGCDEQRAARDAAVPEGGPKIPLRATDAPAAFDLTASTDGAVLVWAAPRAVEAGLRVQRFDVHGVARGPSRRIDVSKSGPGRVLEVAAASSGQTLSVGWVSAEGRTGRAFASSGDLESGAFAAPSLLGGLEVGSSTRRGNLALAVRSGAAPLAFTRRGEEMCGERNAGPCTAFGFHALEAGGPAPRGLPLSVPATCDVGVAGLIVVQDRWHYGVCALKSGRRVTTVFSVESERQYARADELMPGCIPLGMTRVKSELVLGADCGGEWRGARLRRDDAPATQIESELELACDRGQLTLRARGGPEFSATLEGPLEHLEALLPPRRFGSGARALWTGSAVLIASSDGSGVTLRRDECRENALVTTGTP
jgi:hypothetical protein